MPENYIRKPNSECAICSKPVYRRPFQIKRSKGRVFCSTKCYGISCRKETPCCVCGKLMLSSYNKKTCSRVCANKRRIGTKYKLGRPLKDKVVNQRSIKLRLIKLHGKYCERCKYAVHEILQVHHRDKNKNNNEFNNLELICPNCHAKEHFLEKS